MAAAATGVEREASEQSGVHRAVRAAAVLHARAVVQPAGERCVACGERDERVLRRVKLERERVVLCANDRERVRAAWVRPVDAADVRLLLLDVLG